jgi:hypothetical protein
MIRILRLLPTVLASLGLLTACAGQNAATGNANFVPSSNDGTNRQVFHFTGGSQTLHVPKDVDKLTIIAKGAGTPSARGGLAKATIAVHHGALLIVTVGGAPQGYRAGYNGGGAGGFCAYNGPCQMIGKGGAGASDVRIDSDELQDRILVAGGAGGRGGHAQYHGGPGGEGGGLGGGIGDDGIGASSPYGFGSADGGGGGGGGTQLRGGRGGAGGKGSGGPFVAPGVAGDPGTLRIGGTGGNGGGLGDIAGGAGGGGGGGFYGGGGGGSGASAGDYENHGNLLGVASGGGGGGGSSFVKAGAQNVQIEKGKGNSGDGLIIISW